MYLCNLRFYIGNKKSNFSVKAPILEIEGKKVEMHYMGSNIE